MAKIKYDVRNVEKKNFEQPTPGLYKVKVKEVEHRSDRDNPDLHVTLEVTSKKFRGAWLHTYIGLGEASAWKLKELVEALGMKGTGTLDTQRMVGKELNVKVTGDSYTRPGTKEAEYRARVGTLMPLDADPDEEDDDEDGTEEPDEDEDEDDDEEEEDDEDDEEDDEDDEDEESEDGYDDLTVAQLKAECKKRGLKTTGKTDDLIERLREDDAAEDEDDEDEDEDEEDGDNYDDEEAWSLAELKAELKTRELSTKGKRAQLIERLREDDADDSAF